MGEQLLEVGGHKVGRGVVAEADCGLLVDVAQTEPADPRVLAGEYGQTRPIVPRPTIASPIVMSQALRA